MNVVTWARPDRLLGYAQEEAAHHLLAGEAFVVDPERGELVGSAPLHGSVLSAIPTKRGAAFLVSPVTRIGRARVVLIDARGGLRSVPLERTTAGFVDPGTPGESEHRDPALVARGNALYVIGAFEPVARVDIRSGEVSYHRVPGLMEARGPGETHPPTGTAGALESFSRTAWFVGRSLILVSGRETHVVRGGSRLHEFERVPQVVHVRTWRVRRSFRGSGVTQVAGRIVLGRSYDGSLVALRRNGSVLYRRRGSNRSWTVVGDRLVETGTGGRAAVELDLHTGRKVRDLGSLGPWWLDPLPGPSPSNAAD